jgi:hypothetical protein
MELLNVVFFEMGVVIVFEHFLHSLVQLLVEPLGVDFRR